MDDAQAQTHFIIHEEKQEILDDNLDGTHNEYNPGCQHPLNKNGSFVSLPRSFLAPGEEYCLIFGQKIPGFHGEQNISCQENEFKEGKLNILGLVIFDLHIQNHWS